MREQRARLAPIAIPMEDNIVHCAANNWTCDDDSCPCHLARLEEEDNVIVVKVTSGHYLAISYSDASMLLDRLLLLANKFNRK